jgi:hypothetical protein
VSEPSKEPQHSPGIVAAVIGLGSNVLGGLPGQFIALLAVNCVFVLGLLWFLNNQNVQRVALVDHLLTACLQSIDRRQ